MAGAGLASCDQAGPSRRSRHRCRRSARRSMSVSLCASLGQAVARRRCGGWAGGEVRNPADQRHRHGRDQPIRPRACRRPARCRGCRARSGRAACRAVQPPRRVAKTSADAAASHQRRGNDDQQRARRAVNSVAAPEVVEDRQRPGASAAATNRIKAPGRRSMSDRIAIAGPSSCAGEYRERPGTMRSACIRSARAAPEDKCTRISVGSLGSGGSVTCTPLAP